MRCADLGPTPGRQRSDWISSSSAAGLSMLFNCWLVPRLEGQVHAGREIEPRREARHLRLRDGLGLRNAIVERGRDEIFEHVLVFAEKRRIDRDLLHRELARHRDFHESRARLAFDLGLRELLLHLPHVLLHLLRLLHQGANAAFVHHGFAPFSSAGLIDEATTSAPKSRTSSRTNGSASMDCAAASRRCSSSFDRIAATLAPDVSPTRTTSRSPGPNALSSSAWSFSVYGRSAYTRCAS